MINKVITIRLPLHLSSHLSHHCPLLPSAMYLIQDDVEEDEDDETDSTNAELSKLQDYLEFFHIPSTEERRAIIREALVRPTYLLFFVHV